MVFLKKTSQCSLLVSGHAPDLRVVPFVRRSAGLAVPGLLPPFSVVSWYLVVVLKRISLTAGGAARLRALGYNSDSKTRPVSVQFSASSARVSP